ncbi:MAG: T9SS type A sorting domain-containing protein [Lentimicrobium sp.]
MKLTYKFLSAIPVLILTSFIFSHAMAQDPIPNPGFEEWSSGEPVGWNTINQNIFGTDFTCVTRDQSNPHTGTYCAKIQTITQNIFIVGPVTMPGILSLGEITLDVINQTGTVSGGVPIDTRPNILKGWFRYLPAAGDSCIMGIGLSRWNGTGRDTLAYGYTTIGGQNPNWQEFSLPIDYLIWEMPDTMNIMFFSSNLLTGSPVTGSVLYVDDLMLEYGPVSVSNTGKKDEMSLRYSGEDRLIILNPGSNPAEVRLYGLNGSCVGKVKPDAGQPEIEMDISRLRPGIYIARVINSDGSSSSLKFSRL